MTHSVLPAALAEADLLDFHIVGEIIIVAVLGHDGNGFFEKTRIDFPCLEEDAEKKKLYGQRFIQEVKFENIKKLNELGKLHPGVRVKLR